MDKSFTIASQRPVDAGPSFGTAEFFGGARNVRRNWETTVGQFNVVDGHGTHR